MNRKSIKILLSVLRQVWLLNTQDLLHLNSVLGLNNHQIRVHVLRHLL